MALVPANLRASDAVTVFAADEAAGGIAPVDEVARAPFDLVEHQPDILANDAEKEQLDAAKETHRGDQGRPAAYLGPADRVEHQLGDAAQHAECRDRQAKADAEPQRHLGKRANAVERERE